jgi:hypothetical protein
MPTACKNVELTHAARELDERCYRQKFQASFENLGHECICQSASAELALLKQLRGKTALLHLSAV